MSTAITKGKQYKNVYTILEKVKKGEISGHYDNASGGLFGKINFYKKADLIEPHIHYIDQYKIESIVDNAMMNKKNIEEYYQRFKGSGLYGKIEKSKQPNMDVFYTKLKDNYKNFPKHLKYDIHKMYYNSIDKLKFADRTELNNTKYKFLEKANNPVGKIMSEGSNLKSAIFTKQMMLYYMMQMTMMEYTDPDAHEQMQNGLDEKPGSGFDSNAIDDAMKKMTDSQLSKGMLDKAMKDAEETCKIMDQHLDNEMQERMFEDAYKGSGDGTAGDLSPEYFRTIKSRLENINLSMGPLKEKLQKILDKSKAFFSARKIVTYDDFLNAQDVSGLDDYDLLHPKLRKMFIEDIMIKEHKFVGKMDVYVDVSGSMASTCGMENSEGRTISKIDFSKSLIAKLKQMDMLNDVYLFDTRVKKHRNDMVSIAIIDAGGGTTTNNAVKSIEAAGNNALVITDAEDTCNLYSQKAFFVGVQGAMFNNFHNSYMKNNQCIVFDGKTVRQVNELGYAV